MFQLKAPARILHLAFNADLSPFSKTSLPFRPDENSPLGFVRGNGSSLISRQQSSPFLVMQTSQLEALDRKLFKAAIMRAYFTGIFFFFFFKEVINKAHMYCRKFRKKKKERTKRNINHDPATSELPLPR